jgi:mRNA-degrading endonuclease YafQ of YafQ-DinJ toxin-antitoxin module
MIRKDFKKSLQKIVKKYFKGDYSKSVNVLTNLSDIFEDEKLNGSWGNLVEFDKLH